ncbi:hypothetical protein D3C76_1714600 [compost metagenome]
MQVADPVMKETQLTKLTTHLQLRTARTLAAMLQQNKENIKTAYILHKVKLMLKLAGKVLLH